MKANQKVEIAGFKVIFDGVQDTRGPNYIARRGLFTGRKGYDKPFKLFAEKRRYIVGGQETTEAAIQSSWLGDLYVVIGEGSEQGGQTVRLYFMPMVGWIWMGAAIMVLGGFVSLTDRRLRVGAPNRRASELAPAE